MVEQKLDTNAKQAKRRKRIIRAELKRNWEFLTANNNK
jgi:hypothetical protein